MFKMINHFPLYRLPIISRLQFSRHVPCRTWARSLYGCGLLIITILLLAGLYGGWFGSPAVAVASSIQAKDLQQNCSGSYTVNHTLSTGAKWEFCWEYRNREGIVFHNIYYTTGAGTRRKVLKQAGLAQVHTPYHDNGFRHHYVTDLGLGGAQMVPLTAADCPDGTLLSHQGVNVLCQQVEGRGYIYKSYAQQRQGEYLSLYSVSGLGSQSLIVRWRFYDNGTIEPAVGSTGYIQHVGVDPQFGWPMDDNGTIGIGYINNYYWRIDFDIGENGSNDIVEEFNVNPAEAGTKKVLSITQLGQESARSIDPQRKRSWRIRDAAITNSDGHPISYHLEPLAVGNRYIGPDSEPWAKNDIYFTAYQPCEQFATHNPPINGCGDNVTTFTNDENINGADLVVWYRASYHHLPSNEYQPYIPVHWDSFVLIPRDWTAKSE